MVQSSPKLFFQHHAHNFACMCVRVCVCSQYTRKYVSEIIHRWFLFCPWCLCIRNIRNVCTCTHHLYVSARYRNNNQRAAVVVVVLINIAVCRKAYNMSYTHCLCSRMLCAIIVYTYICTLLLLLFIVLCLTTVIRRVPLYYYQTLFAGRNCINGEVRTIHTICSIFTRFFLCTYTYYISAQYSCGNQHSVIRNEHMQIHDIQTYTYNEQPLHTKPTLTIHIRAQTVHISE